MPLIRKLKIPWLFTDLLLMRNNWYLHVFALAFFAGHQYFSIHFQPLSAFHGKGKKEFGRKHSQRKPLTTTITLFNSYLNKVKFTLWFWKSLDLQISSLVGYFKKTNDFIVYAISFHETIHDKWCLHKKGLANWKWIRIHWNVLLWAPPIIIIKF